MISLDDYLMGRDKFSPFSEELKSNAEILLKKVNMLLAYTNIHPENYPGKDNCVSSGWRPPDVNAQVPNAAPKSKHITCQAIDIYDPEGSIDDFLFDNQQVLVDCDLYMEHPSATKNWCHLQSLPPKSKKRVFYP